MGFILCLKKFLAIPHSFFQMFHLRKVGIVDSPWCNKSCCAYKELGLGGFYYSIRKKLPSPSIYLKPTPKKYYRKKNHAYLNLMYSICHIVNIYRLGKSTKFPMLSISIPSSSYSTTKTLSERFSSSSVNTWFSLKIELERLIICKKSFSHFILFHLYLFILFIFCFFSWKTKF